ncbi:MAG: fasciclin domain-containing protein [Nodosilinea sp.]
MSPNTIRIALGLGMLAAIPVAVATFPQEAMSESATPQVEPMTPGATPTAPTVDPTAPGVDPAAPEVDPAAPEVDPAAPEVEVEPQAEEPTSGQTIADLAAGNDDFEILTAALDAAGLTEALSSDTISVTVFAPTDEAFEALPEGTVDALMQPENRQQLTQLLTYHVVEGAVLSSDLASGEVDTVAGAPVTVMVDGEAVTINQANLVGPDIEASNGVIHVIDAVLQPE